MGPESTEHRQGLVQIYTGDGKGKTTAALGLALRAMGHGLSVAVVQFLKGEDKPGEVLFAEKIAPSMGFYRFGTGDFIIGRSPSQEEIRLAEQGVGIISKLMSEQTVDLLILDEVSHAVNLGLITVNVVVDLINARPQAMELVLTGRDFPEQILDTADLVSNIQMVKHPFEQGVPARLGIEY